VALAGKMSDRYMRDFTSFQNKAKPEPVAENINIAPYDDKSPVAEQLQTLFRKDPDVVIVHDLNDKEILELVCKNAAEKMVITTVRAKEAVEALLRVLLLKVPATTVAPLLQTVVNQRLVRKLCEECKEEFVPSPALLKKIGIPADRVEHLYQPPTDEDQPVCKACGGIGYVGRTSIFELLQVDDSIREALVSKPKLEVLRQVAKKAGHRTLQDEGVLLVAQGVTSLAELSRALKS
jgi:type II secretory ATPase GspE/PulE/Tfp pilus assembly ATPase PilB-like protein